MWRNNQWTHLNFRSILETAGWNIIKCKALLLFEPADVINYRRIQVFRDVTWCHWVIGSWHFEETWCIQFQSWWDQEEFFIAQKAWTLNRITVETLNLAWKEGHHTNRYWHLPHTILWYRYKLRGLSLFCSCCSCIRTQYLCLQEHEAIF